MRDACIRLSAPDLIFTDVDIQLAQNLKSPICNPAVSFYWIEIRMGTGPEILQYVIREMQCSDLHAVVEVHQRAFEGFFLTRMGPRFLHAYYETALNYDGKIALLACNSEDQSVVAGFATGFQDPQGFYSLFSQRRKKMIPTILWALLRSPNLLPQILRNSRRVEKQASQHVEAVELSSIAVGEPGKGIGGFLLEAFSEKAKTLAARKLILTTDAENNEAVRKFYEARGFTLDGIEMRADRKLCCYSKELG